MIPRRTLATALALGAGAFAAGFAASRWLRTAATTPGPPVGEVASNPAPSRAVKSASDDSADPAPDFRFTDQDGVERRLSDWRDVVRVVNFWGTWCPPCVHEIPVLIAVQEALRARGVQVVGVAVDEPDDAFAMAREVGMNYPTMADARRTLDLLRAYGNRTATLPFTAFVDRAGRIRDRHVGALTLEQARERVEALLS